MPYMVWFDGSDCELYTLETEEKW